MNIPSKDPRNGLTKAQRAYNDALCEQDFRQTAIAGLSRSAVTCFVAYFEGARDRVPWSDEHKAHAAQHGLTPQEYALELIKEGFDDMLEVLKTPEEAARDAQDE